MFESTYKNQLEKLFNGTYKANNGYIHYVGNVVYRTVPHGIIIRGEITEWNGKPVLTLTAISKTCGKIDSIDIPLHYVNHALDWYNGMSDDEISIVAAQIDAYIDAFRE